MDVSIIIPTRDRCDALRRTLASLQTVDFTSNQCEILVVDNGSTDQTRQVADAATRGGTEPPVRYFFEPIPGLLSGRHRGALEAKGDICYFLDDDVRVNRDSMNALGEAFRTPSVALVGGPSHPLFAVEPAAWLEEFYSETEEGRHCSWLSLFDGGSAQKEINPKYVWGLNYAIRKSVLFECGGFHPDCMPKRLQRFQGDGESGLNCKIAAAGLKTIYVPGAGVMHEVAAPRMTAEYFESRAFYEGVCDSYSQVRKSGQAPAPASAWKQAGRSVKRFVRSFRGNAIQRRAEEAYYAGFHFHQAEVSRDPALLAWVLRPDYWNYALPGAGSLSAAHPTPSDTAIQRAHAS